MKLIEMAVAAALTFGVGAARAEGPHYEIKKSEPKVAPGGKGQASVTIATKDGWHVNAEAPITIALEPPAGVTLPKPKQAEFFLVDGVIVTGARTTEPPAPAELRRARKAARVPVVIGSGMTPENIGTYLKIADGFIVGSTFREKGDYLALLDPKRLEAFMKRFRTLRKSVRP